MDVDIKHSNVNGVLTTIVRYALAFSMLPYGWSKLCRLQFQVSAWNYALLLGQTSGKTLLWATMGYSPKLQMVLGMLELVPSVLLLISRTKRIGALLMLPAAANVALLNFSLDLWLGTKIISCVLLLLNLVLLAYDCRLYLPFFRDLVAPQTPIVRGKLRIAAEVGMWLLPFAFVLFFYFAVQKPVDSIVRANSDLVGVRQINRAGTWKIKAMSVDGNEEMRF